MKIIRKFIIILLVLLPIVYTSCDKEILDCYLWDYSLVIFRSFQDASDNNLVKDIEFIALDGSIAKRGFIRSSKS